MGRECLSCGEYKDSEFFTPFKEGKNGLYPICKECRKPKSQKQYKEERPEYKLYYRAKRRAKVKNLEFSISEKDIFIPERCPVLDIPMEVPSLDRKNPYKGYTPDNISVISNRANTLKNNATKEELQAVLNYVVAIGNVQDG